MKRILSALVLGVGLLAPVAVVNAQRHQDVKHEWNDGENNAWRKYLKEHHKKDHDWTKAKKREQLDYWKWREQHHDR